MATIAFEPIGVVRSPFGERVEAPRQPPLAKDVAGRVELIAGKGYEDALDGLAKWERMWILFVFHKNVEEGRGWKAKVQPPRSATKQGVFATRSPHRPNPIGLSAVVIDRVEGLVVHVRGIDLLDGTPVLDIKPYVAYADAFADARAGWLETKDPLEPWQVVFVGSTPAQLQWLKERGVDLQPSIEAALSMGPAPHAYRRIRVQGDALRLSLKAWRADFAVEERRILVRGLSSGYRPKELSTDAALELHRAFMARFP